MLGTRIWKTLLWDTIIYTNSLCSFQFCSLSLENNPPFVFSLQGKCKVSTLLYKPSVNLPLYHPSSHTCVPIPLLHFSSPYTFFPRLPEHCSLSLFLHCGRFITLSFILVLLALSGEMI